MNIKDLCYIGMVVVTGIITVATTLLTRRSRSKSTDENKNTDSGSSGVEESISTAKTVLEKVTGYMIGAEKLYNQLSTGKTGSMKLQDVLKNIKVDCLTSGISYDEDTWKQVIENIISATKSINNN